jgi:hypothetical protein
VETTFTNVIQFVIQNVPVVKITFKNKTSQRQFTILQFCLSFGLTYSTLTNVYCIVFVISLRFVHNYLFEIHFFQRHRKNRMINKCAEDVVMSTVVCEKKNVSMLFARFVQRLTFRWK